MPGAATTRAAITARLEAGAASLAARGRPRLAAMLAHARERVATTGDDRLLHALADLERVPVAIDTFIDSPEFLDKRRAVWPTLRADLRRLNPDVLTGAPPVTEAHLGGATGIGKSTVARITLLYQLYLLTCFRDPQGLFGLDRETRIVFVVQSVSPEVTERVLYAPLRQAFEAMPYARRHLSWDRRRTTALELDGGLHVVPLLANPDALLGQAVIGGILDEINFMRVVERSVRVAGPRGQGGRYDQAEQVYRELAQRRASRFAGAPLEIGSLILSSSAHYADDFLARRIQAAQASAQPNVVSLQHTRYDVVPPERYSGVRMRVLVGDARQRTRILGAHEPAPPESRVESVPVEHRPAFLQNPEHALRTIVGVPSAQLRPFLDPDLIAQAFHRGAALGLPAWVARTETRLACDPWPRWQAEALPDADGCERFLHIDLATTRDACGLAIVRVDGFTADASCADAPRPRFVAETALALQPAPDAELVLADLRRWVFELVGRHGVALQQVSFDGYQSRDFQQVLRQAGLGVQEISVDRTPAPYEHLRDCLVEGRLALPDCPRLHRELLHLERDPARGTIDHPPRGSKDVADALCGALWAAVGSRSVRAGLPEARPPGRPRPERPKCERPPGRRHGERAATT